MQINQLETKDIFNDNVSSLRCQEEENEQKIAI
jgi:hypothetical protein